MEVDHAWLDDGDALLRVDTLDAVEAIQGDDQAVGYGQGAAGEAGAAAAGQEGHLVLVAEADGGDDFVFVLRQHDCARLALEGGQAVRFVGQQLDITGQETVGRVDGFEGLQEGVVHEQVI